MTSHKKRLNLKQHAVLWEFSGPDRNGEPKVKPPIPIRCRWEHDNRQLESESATITTDATVYVDREIVLGSMMRLGNANDLASSPAKIMEVVGYWETTNLKGRVVERHVALRRWKESLPTII